MIKFNCDKCGLPFEPDKTWESDQASFSKESSDGPLDLVVIKVEYYQGQKSPDICSNCIRILTLEALDAAPKGKRVLELE